jgi:DNA-binding MarR family transcriptional regulator
MQDLALLGQLDQRAFPRSSIGGEADQAARAESLEQVRDRPGIRLQRLGQVRAQLSRVRKQTMAQAIEQLESAGYVERRPDPGDRRARLVFLTDRGKAVRPVGTTAGRRVEERWAELTSPEEVEALRRSLQRLLDALSEPSRS